MIEIELKAHVQERNEVIKNLNNIAKYKNQSTKDDCYFKNNNDKQIRIRKQITINQDSTKECTTFITYKRKEKKDNIEVNDEKECTISDAKVLEVFLEDCGFSIALKKHKDVMLWTSEINIPQDLKVNNIPKTLEVNFELCTVKPLGDFLEIEIPSLVPQSSFVIDNHCVACHDLRIA